MNNKQFCLFISLSISALFCAEHKQDESLFETHPIHRFLRAHGEKAIDIILRDNTFPLDRIDLLSPAQKRHANKVERLKHSRRGIKQQLPNNDAVAELLANGCSLSQ